MKIKVLRPFKLRKDMDPIEGLSGKMTVSKIIHMPEDRARNAINAGLAVAVDKDGNEIEVKDEKPASIKKPDARPQVNKGKSKKTKK